jgi:hypothetical protein
MRSPATRRFLLAIAAILDRRAQAIRAYCKRHTPRRKVIS